MGDEFNNEEKGFGDVIYENFGPGGSAGKLKRVLEFMIYFVGFLGTILTIPEAYKIWTTQSAAGSSIVSWISLTLFTPFWIFYGILHKKKSLTMTYVVWFIINALVVVGIWLFG
ncbi:MAG: hypothetical protein ABIH92_03550 [Nanoarchaeota archaeon]